MDNRGPSQRQTAEIDITGIKPGFIGYLATGERTIVSHTPGDTYLERDVYKIVAEGSGDWIRARNPKKIRERTGDNERIYGENDFLNEASVGGKQESPWKIHIPLGRERYETALSIVLAELTSQDSPILEFKFLPAPTTAATEAVWQKMPAGRQVVIYLFNFNVADDEAVQQVVALLQRIQKKLIMAGIVPSADLPLADRLFSCLDENQYHIGYRNENDWGDDGKVAYIGAEQAALLARCFLSVHQEQAEAEAAMTLPSDELAIAHLLRLISYNLGKAADPFLDGRAEDIDQLCADAMVPCAPRLQVTACKATTFSSASDDAAGPAPTIPPTKPDEDEVVEVQSPPAHKK